MILSGTLSLADGLIHESRENKLSLVKSKMLWNVNCKLPYFHNWDQLCQLSNRSFQQAYPGTYTKEWEMFHFCFLCSSFQFHFSIIWMNQELLDKVSNDTMKRSDMTTSNDGWHHNGHSTICWTTMCPSLHCFPSFIAPLNSPYPRGRCRVVAQFSLI